MWLNTADSAVNIFEDFLVDECTITRTSVDMETLEPDPITFELTIPDATIIAENVKCLIRVSDQTETADPTLAPGTLGLSMTYRVRVPLATYVEAGDLLTVTTGRVHSGLVLRVLEGQSHSLAAVKTLTAVVVERL